MKSIIMLIMVIALCGCRDKTELNTFNTIDYSFYAGYFRSIKIFNDGQVYIWYQYDYPESNKYYSLKLDKNSLDIVSKMAKILFNVKFDSMYNASLCDHPISLSLIIKSKERTLVTSYYGDLVEKEWSSLFNFAKFLDNLSNKAREHLDSTFVFESKSRLILPPPSPPRPN